MPNGDIINNTYAGDGFRVAKQVNGTTTKYVYIGDKVVLELDGAGNQIAKNVQGTTTISRTVGGTTLYYMFNGHADVTALIDAVDAVQATYYYDAFGNIITSTGSVNNPYTYAGYQYDEETGYYYLQSRFYDPITARFLSEDTYRGDPNDPLSLNLYTYCHNEPIKYTDPTGHYIDETTLGTLVKEGYTSVVLVYEPGKGDTLVVTGKGMTLTITDNRKDVRYDPIDTVHDLSCWGNEKKSSDIKSTGQNKTVKKSNSPTSINPTQTKTNQTSKTPATQTTPKLRVKTPTAAELANTLATRDDYLWMLEHGYIGNQGMIETNSTDKNYGVEDGTAYLGEYKIAYDNEGILTYNTNAYGATASVEGKAVVGYEPNWKGTKTKGGKDKEVGGIDVRASAGATVGTVIGNGQIGNKNFGVFGGAEGDVGSAEAYAAFAARSNGVGLRAGAEASLLNGEISGGINVLGYQIKVGAEGAVAGVGARAELGVMDGQLKARVKLVAGLGGGFWFQIGEAK